MIENLAAVSGYLIVGAVCLLAGAAMGYYTAATDLQRDRSRVWQDAYDRGVIDGEYRERDSARGARRQPPAVNPYRAR